MHDSLSQLATQAVQRALDTDPANAYYLGQLNGCRIKVHSTLPSASLDVQIRDSEVSLSLNEEHDQADYDLQINGTAISLVKLAASPPENTSNLRESGIKVSGDAGLLLDLARLSRSIEIDWERLMIDQIGDVPGILLGRGLNLAASQARRAKESLVRQVDQKLDDDREHVVKRDQLQVLKKQLRELNYRIDRLQALSDVNVNVKAGDKQ